jgi:Tol biopolymer transport system component
VEWHPTTARDIWALPLDGNQPAEPILSSEHDEYSPTLSPNRRWLAYVSDESGRYEVYVRSWPESTSKIPVSVQGGIDPAWSADGRELFYRNGGAMMFVPVEDGTVFSAGGPERLFESRYQFGVHGSFSYDVSADGRFLMVEPSSGQAIDRLDIVVNWFEELKRLVPTE